MNKYTKNKKIIQNKLKNKRINLDINQITQNINQITQCIQLRIHCVTEFNTIMILYVVTHCLRQGATHLK